MFGWITHRVSNLSAHLENQKKCIRCGLLYRKVLDKCDHCGHLTDFELKTLIQQREAFRLNLGKSMILGAFVVVLLMVVFI